MHSLIALFTSLMVLLPSGRGDCTGLANRGPVCAPWTASPASPGSFDCPTGLPGPSSLDFETIEESAFDEEDPNEVEDPASFPALFRDFPLSLPRVVAYLSFPVGTGARTSKNAVILRC